MKAIKGLRVKLLSCSDIPDAVIEYALKSASLPWKDEMLIPLMELIFGGRCVKLSCFGGYMSQFGADLVNQAFDDLKISAIMDESEYVALMSRVHRMKSIVLMGEIATN